MKTKTKKDWCECCDSPDSACDCLGAKTVTHTPTLWKQTGRKVSGGEYQTEAIGVSLSGKTSEPHMVTAHEVMFTLRHEADAAFICRAVNAHSELVSLLKHINEFLSEGMSLNPGALIDDCEEAKTFAEAVKKAIANAEGK